MKTSKFVCTIVSALVLAVSCEHAKFLDRAPYSTTSPENFYKTPADMRMALVSCYETLNTHKIPGLSYCQRGSYGQGLIYLMNAPADDVVGFASSNGEGVEMENCTFDEGSLPIRHFWKVYYTGINRCNIILAYLPGIEGLSDAEKTQYEAEARFMRAFFYYHLAWNFGGVPLITDYASKGDESRSPLKDVYDLILGDFEFAYQHLQPVGGTIANVSADKYTAGAYLGRICNYLAACKRYGTGASLVAEQPLNDFSFVNEDEMSARACNVLRDVCENTTRSLNPDYRLNFLECSKAAQYQECLFLSEIPLSGTEGYWPNSFYLPTPSNNGIVFPTAYGGRHMPTYIGFYMYSPKDARRDWNYCGRLNDGYREFQQDGYTYGIPTYRDSVTVKIVDSEGKPVMDPETGQQKQQKILHPLYDSETQTFRANSGMQICTGKFRLAAYDQVQHTNQQHALSYPLMRLADVYLMFAEALYFTGNEGEGREWMDKVLRRAATDEENFLELKEAYHRDDFIEELLESRERELFMEFSRKWDLIRFNRIDAAIAAMNPHRVDAYKGPEIEEKYLEIAESNNMCGMMEAVQRNWMPFKIWLPISEEQIGVNRNLTQNAGWGVVETL